MKWVKEFKEFIMTGNVIDFAVAVILAGAVGAVVTGFVQFIMMPIIGELVGGMNFSDLKYVLSPAVGTEGEEGFIPENAIKYGAWIDSIINLFTVGWVLFLIVKGYNKMNKKEEEAPAGPTTDELLTQIRDILIEKD